MKLTTSGLLMSTMVAALSTVACGPAEPASANGDFALELRLPSASDAVRTALQSAKRGLRELPAHRLPTVDLGGGAAQPPSVALPGECQVAGQAGARVQVAALPGAGLSPKVDGQFVAASTPRLYLTAVLRNVCGAHTGSFDLYTPQGEFYTRLSTPFSTSAGAGVRLEGQAYVVELELPIAGTEIESRGLYGTWSINYLQDQGSLALGLGEFVLVAE